MNKVSITAHLTCVHLDKHLCDQGVGENECVIVWIRDTVGESFLKSRRLALLKQSMMKCLQSVIHPIRWEDTGDKYPTRTPKRLAASWINRI